MGALTEREGREQGKQLESEHTWETMRLYRENGLGGQQQVPEDVFIL